MQRSTERILTTHIGSLPRPDDLRGLLQARDRGEEYDPAALAGRVRSAVSEVVGRQAEVGIDIVADGEQGKNSFTNYIRERLTGFEAVNPDPYPGPPEAFPRYAASLVEAQSPFSALRGTPPLNVGPITWKNRDDLAADIANLKAALEGLDVTEAFMPAV